MKYILCTDVGCCNETITAENDLKLRNQFFDHVRNSHPDLFKSMTQDMKRDLNQKLLRFRKTI
jgi:predicted small metal-binding protein